MKLNKKLLWSSLMMMLLIITIMVTMVPMITVTSADPATYIYIDPPEKNATGESMGYIFPIDIWVYNAPKTYAWELHISWDSNIVELFFKQEGDFLSSAGSTSFGTYPSTPPWDDANAAGEIMVGCTLTTPGLPMDQWANGTGWLCRLGFEVVGNGSALFDLFDTVLLDHIEWGVPAPTPYPNEDGFFYNVDPSHDIKITDVTIVDALVYGGEVANINVTVLNEGTQNESITLNVYANETLIDTTVLSLNGTGSFENRSVTHEVAWNTTGFAEGIYTVNATASTVLGETDTADNILIDGTVNVKIPGDVNSDGTVDGSDLIRVSEAFGSQYGGPNWDEDCDFNGDGKVDASDMFDLGKNFGRSE